MRACIPDIAVVSAVASHNPAIKSEAASLTSCAVLCCAVLCCAVLCCAVLCCAIAFCAAECLRVFERDPKDGEISWQDDLFDLFFG
jgi:hypothetical protein